MSEIDRRMMFGAMGAGLVLAGCNKHPEKVRSAADDCSDDCVETKGLSKNFGELATKTRTDPFRTKYIFLTYMKFDQGNIIIQHGYIRLGEDGTPQEYDSSDKNVKEKSLIAINGFRKNDFNNIINAKYNFEHYSMGGQMVMVFFIDNKESIVAFNDQNGNDAIIRFTEASSIDIKRKINCNYAFANLRMINIDDNTTSSKAYRLDFYNTKKGYDIDPKNAIILVDEKNPNTYYYYSMNLHLQYRVAPGSSSISRIPIIIDPDPGNMGGDP